MKFFFYFLTAALLSTNLSYGQDQEIDSSEDEKKVKDATVIWADNTFYKHSDYKFEHFHAFYTEEYFIATMRTRMYKERLDLLESKKESGRYKKTEEEYQKEHTENKEAYTKVKNELDNMHNRVTHFEIHFWSNIQTNDGITVYYEHIVKLDNDYQVTSAEVHSAIGKKSDKTEILYKKNINDRNKNLKDRKDDSKVIKTDDRSGSVTITTKPSPTVEEDKIEEDFDKKSKKKKKKEKK
jgi:hypothetical protein